MMARLMKVHVAPEFVLGTMVTGVTGRIACISGVPSDTRIAWSYYDAPSNSFVMVIEHPSFVDLPEGGTPPRLDPMFAPVVEGV